MSTRVVAVLLWATLRTSTVAAQEVALPKEVRPGPAGKAIDLAALVAAKSVALVQQAPGIITLISAEELTARGQHWLLSALATVPGWQGITVSGDQVAMPLVRGVGQSALLLRDGVALFDPTANIGWFGRTQPMETVKRLEVVTGPGGVLFGANSLLGVVNLVSKEAEDINGLELSAGYGDGPGNGQDFKGYALFGKAFGHGRVALLQHVSFESYRGAVFDGPLLLANSVAPAPAGDAWFGAPRPSPPERSWFVIVDGHYRFGPLSLSYLLPVGESHPQLTFGNALVSHNRFDLYDRYGVLSYQERFWTGRLHLTAKAYAIQFVRDYDLELFPPSRLFPDGPHQTGGLRFGIAGQQIFRLGAILDLAVSLPWHLRLLGGGELFYEAQTASRAHFVAPAADALPILCPLDGSGHRLPGCPRPYAVATSRAVAAAYLDLQWRPLPALALDGGLRLQGGVGPRSYPLVPLGSAAVVVHPAPEYQLKVDYATGFRPPVFQNTSVVPGGVGFGANPRLRTESSRAFEGEFQARVLREVRQIRQLLLRVDYSYTVLTDIIQIRGGVYGNTGKRALHSIEGYAKLALAGGHVLQAGYTYLHAVTADAGVVRTTPNHWASFGASFNLIEHLLAVNLTLTIFGAYEDPNRYPSGAVGDLTIERTSDLTWDRLTPVADLQLGFHLRLLAGRLLFSGQVYNVLNQHAFYPDAFADLTPTLEIQPLSAPGFSFFTQISYRL